MKKLLSVFVLSLMLFFHVRAGWDIVITEIMYNPPEIGTDSLEFIEIYNNGATSVDLAGFYFAMGVDYTFGNITINSGDYIVIAVDSLAALNVYGIHAYQWTSGGLSNSGEAIVIKDQFGNLVDSVRYGNSAPWPTDPNGNGSSLELCDPSSENSDASNWSVSQKVITTVNGKSLRATPGEACYNPPPPPAPMYTISQVRGLDSLGMPDSLGVLCKLKGVVHSINHRAWKPGYSFVMHDGTAGIWVYLNTGNLNYDVRMGDEIEVRGLIDQYRGLLEIIPDSIYLIDSFKVLNSPVVISDVFESLEGEMVTFKNAWLVDTNQWPKPTNYDVNVDITNGTDTLLMRITTECELHGTPIPYYTFDLTAVVGQYDNSSPYFSGYQLFPSLLSDLVKSPYPMYDVVINELLADNIADTSDPQGEYENWIELYNNDTFHVDLTGWYMSNDPINLNKWELDTHIMDHSFLLIWADEDVNDSGLHANFTLDKNGGVLYLINPDMVVVDSVVYGVQKTDTSYGRIPNGSGNFQFSLSTPNAVNQELPTGIRDIEYSKYFAVYPNPTHGPLVLENKENKDIVIRIIDMLGKEMQVIRSSGNIIPLNMNQNSGLYFVRITDIDNGNTWTQKVIVR
jgi:hypothetical protein